MLNMRSTKRFLAKATTVIWKNASTTFRTIDHARRDRHTSIFLRFVERFRTTRDPMFFCAFCSRFISFHFDATITHPCRQFQCMDMFCRECSVRLLRTGRCILCSKVIKVCPLHQTPKCCESQQSEAWEQRSDLTVRAGSDSQEDDEREHEY